MRKECTGTCPGTEERREPPLSAAVFPGSWRKFGIAEEVAQDSIVQSLCPCGFLLGVCHTMGPEVSLVGGTHFKNQPKPAASLGGTRKHWGALHSRRAVL